MGSVLRFCTLTSSLTRTLSEIEEKGVAYYSIIKKLDTSSLSAVDSAHPEKKEGLGVGIVPLRKRKVILSPVSNHSSRTKFSINPGENVLNTPF